MKDFNLLSRRRDMKGKKSRLKMGKIKIGENIFSSIKEAASDLVQNKEKEKRFLLKFQIK